MRDTEQGTSVPQSTAAQREFAEVWSGWGQTVDALEYWVKNLAFVRVSG